jgi:hypothetical protein
VLLNDPERHLFCIAKQARQYSPLNQSLQSAQFEMAKSKTIKNADILEMLRIVGECRELGDDPIIWRQHFYGRLASLIDADLAAGANSSTVSRRPFVHPEQHCGVSITDSISPA